MGALPDMYVLTAAQGQEVPEVECGYISACVITNMLHSINSTL